MEFKIIFNIFVDDEIVKAFVIISLIISKSIEFDILYLGFNNLTKLIRNSVKDDDIAKFWEPNIQQMKKKGVTIEVRMMIGSKSNVYQL